MSVHDAKETALVDLREILNYQVRVLVWLRDLRYETLSSFITDSINNIAFT